ncbi:Cap22 protein [Colletotrichum higginsianum IMI 349063]|uniref:Cap22 protein n=2 Tax=Colletotrichum higginsianum TaxID=80884 RepID=A0A1B7XXZ7_COLHI|nr:Cap22 protein [Colletotrichum higginsianum IMI 349063]OBR04614.1 Cap22 protein [Colletotrichum higginsianum IMI 349063]TIC94128.1 Protein CAP22 [Colletotrichum higginsianum]GJC99247.1 CAP22 protein [Colletotrichum higginsianum]
MHFNRVALSLAAAAFVQADLQLDNDDIPTQCNAVCRPIFSLGQACEVNDDLINNDLTEDRLEAQCVCTNNSINVAQYAALCASCMDQNVQDRDDLDDINDILRTCGFASTSYVATASYASTTPSVSAVRPTNSAQLTTTITPGSGAGSGASPTQSSGSGSGSGNNNNNGGGSSATPTNGNNNQATQTPNAAGVVSPQGLGLLGAAAVGALFL